MPTLLRKYGVRYHFFVGEPEGERPHIHADSPNGKCKIWLDDLTIAKKGGFTEAQLGRIMKVVTQHQNQFLEAWHVQFG